MAKKYFKGGVDRYRVTGADFGDFRRFLNGRPGVISDRVANRFENVGSQAVEVMRETIEKSETKTGRAAQAAGKRTTAGRIRGTVERRGAGKSMYDSVTFQVRKNIPKAEGSRAKNNITLRVGWLNGTPGYAFFQEFGTSNGVQGMNSLGEVDLWLEAHVVRGYLK